jgi:tRNA pseudouridine38-40 synthase
MTEPAAPLGDGGLSHSRPGYVRLRLDLGYDGTDFAGWGVQPDVRTVQGEVEQALARALRLPGPVRTVVAGRTDTGVHARAQVAHSDVPVEAWASLLGRGADFPIFRLRSALPEDVRLTAIGPAPDGFNARWSASWRRYAYRVDDTVPGPDPTMRRQVLHRTGPNSKPFDLDLMNNAADTLLGEHDFCAFCRRREGASTVRTLTQLRWRRDAETGLAVLDVQADAFCHTMVRALAGALLMVGLGQRDGRFPASLLGRKDRDPHAEVAQPHGLTLEEIRYPPDDQLAAAAERSRRFRGLLD